MIISFIQQSAIMENHCLLAILQIRGQHTVSVKKQIANISDFAGQTVSVASYSALPHIVARKTVIDNM
jgi:hypothetical protein